MKRIMILLTPILLLSACTLKLGHQPDQNITSGLFTPVNLEPDTTIIHISDYIPDQGLVDSVSMSFMQRDQFQRSGDEVLVISSPEMPMLVVLKLWVGRDPYAVLLKKSQKQKVKLVFDPGKTEYEVVQARGEFNGWTAKHTPFFNVNGQWIAELLINPGTYQYLLVLDGDETTDPGNPDSVSNNAGGFNSLLSVGQENKKLGPALMTDEIDGCEIDISSENELAESYVFWENYLLPGNYVEHEDDGDVEIRVPPEARSMKRTYIRMWAANKYGFSNEILVPLEYGKVLEAPSLITRDEPYGMILYNVFVDRFENGDKQNDRPVDDPAIRPPANHHGGDIAGVIEKIKDGYFTQLGINTIWLSPVILNPDGAYGYWPDPPSKFSGYHGYWPISFTQIDPRFGTAGELRELVELAHDNGLNVLLDFVANHVHEDHPVYKQHPDWATELYLPDGTLNTEKWDEYRLTTWFDVFLPTLDLAKPEVYQMLSDSAVWWIREYQLDGFRHDATKHIPEVFWRTLTHKLKTEVALPEKRNIYQIGETYGSPELIRSYVSTGMLDGQFDFNVYDEALAVFIRPDESFERLNDALQESLDFYGAHNLMGYITGNQDRGRFVSYAGGDLLFEEDAKAAGWSREIGAGDPVAYKRLAMLFAFNMSIPGIPVIYYGDEIGMPGGNDPDSRRMMRFGDLDEKERQLRETVTGLAGLRRGNMALVYGDFKVLQVTKTTFVIARTYFDEIVVTAFNKSPEPAEISFELPGRFEERVLETWSGSIIKKEGTKVTIQVEANGFEVIAGK